MRPTLNFVFIVVLFVGASQMTYTQVPPQSSERETGIATLFARDPLTQSLCFRDGGPGSIFQSGQTRNRCSDLNFDSYTANAFSVGIEGGRQGVIVDLGTPQELKGKYGYSETVGSGQGFASINVRNGKGLILKDYKSGQLQELAESAQLFRNPPDRYSSIPVKIGHVYLIRVTDRHDKAFEVLAKILVIAHVPGESVTIRWSLLSDGKTAKL